MARITVASFETQNGKWAVAVGCSGEIAILSPTSAHAVANRLNGQDVPAIRISGRDMATFGWLNRRTDDASRSQVAKALTDMAQIAISRNRSIVEGGTHEEGTRDTEASQAH